VTESAADDLAAMEASLVALGDGYEGMAAELFEALIAGLPHYASAFMNPEAAQERMTRETLEVLLGLAGGEPWVPATIANFVDLHHNYAAFTAQDYDAWLALVVAAMERRAGDAWPDGARAAWDRQVGRLRGLVADELAHEWTHRA
jgi:hypothetical protein